MTKQTEAMKLALEAAYLAGWNASGEGYNAEYPFGDHKKDPEQDAVWVKDRDNALREALAQQEQKRPQNCGTGYCSCIECVMEPAQQEPKACLVETEQGMMLWPIEDYDEASTYCDAGEYPVELYTSPPAQQEPIGEAQQMSELVEGFTHCIWDARVIPVGTKLYTSPPAQRTWVGLTDEEAEELWESTDSKDDWELMKRTEAKLRSKNT